MKMDELFLKKDQSLATRLLACLGDQLEDVRYNTIRGQLTDAERCLIEAQRCVRELGELAQKKREDDRVKSIVNRLQSQGVNMSKIVEMVTR